MTKQEFFKFMNQLMVIFVLPSKNEEDKEEFFEIYSRQFIHMDSMIFGMAIELLIEIHPHRMIPTVAEINVAISEIKSNLPKEQHYEQECKKCLSMGLWIDETDGLAKACHCPVGKTTRTNLAVYDDNHPNFRRFRESNERQEGEVDEKNHKG